MKISYKELVIACMMYEAKHKTTVEAKSNKTGEWIADNRVPAHKVKEILESMGFEVDMQA